MMYLIIFIHDQQSLAMILLLLTAAAAASDAYTHLVVTILPSSLSAIRSALLYRTQNGKSVTLEGGFLGLENMRPQFAITLQPSDGTTSHTMSSMSIAAVATSSAMSASLSQ